MRRGRAPAVPRPPGRPAGHRPDLHPLPRGPLRRRTRRQRRHGHPRHRTRPLHGARRLGERLRGHRDEPREHPPVELARRYVEALGGVAAVVALAGRYLDDGDPRFAATLLNHAVFADPGDSAARGLLARVYTRLGHGAENATWRNFYLTGAHELTGRPAKPATDTVSPDLLGALTAEQVFDSLAIRVNGPDARNERFTIDWHLTGTGTDADEHHRTTMSNGALIHERDPSGDGADLTLRLTKDRLMTLFSGDGDTDSLDHDGDLAVLRRLTAVLEQPTPNFAIVTP